MTSVLLPNIVIINTKQIHYKQNQMKYIFTPILCTLLASRATATTQVDPDLAEAGIAMVHECQQTVADALYNISIECSTDPEWTQCVADAQDRPEHRALVANCQELIDLTREKEELCFDEAEYFVDEIMEAEEDACEELPRATWRRECREALEETYNRRYNSMYSQCSCI